MPKVWKCRGCNKLFGYKWAAQQHMCSKPPFIKTTITATAFCKKFSHDYRALSWEVVREEVWEEGYLGSPEVAEEHRAPVYKIKVVCKCCGEITYTEKTCYNQAEIPRKGVEVLVGLIVEING